LQLRNHAHLLVWQALRDDAIDLRQPADRFGGGGAIAGQQHHLLHAARVQRWP
jgi:hypothetical protein